jgi:glycerol-1-phosphate dehydrogenase [NAD(P)+]
MMMHLHGGDWVKIKYALRKIGAPTSAAQLGLTKYEVVKALTTAHTVRPERYTILGESGLNREAAEKLARDTGVI